VMQAKPMHILRFFEAVQRIRTMAAERIKPHDWRNHPSLGGFQVATNSIFCVPCMI